MDSLVQLKIVKEDEQEEKRRCKNWLESFMDYTTPRSEAPESVLFWCGLFAISSVLRRNVFISEEDLGGWACYPYIYVIFVGEQGVIKKTTSMGFAEGILDLLEELNLSKCPEAVTGPDLIKKLQDANDSSVYMLLGEFSLLPLKAGFGIYDILTRLFDGAKKIDESTLSRGYIFAANPCLNLCAATTPKWITANISEDILGGGFGSRVIFIQEKAPAKYGLFWRHRIKLEQLEKLKEDLIHDLKIIAKIKGRFEIPGWETPEDITKPYGFLDDWYRKNPSAPKGTDERMKGHYARRPAYVMKVAMLWHLSYASDLVITMEDCHKAIAIMKEAEMRIAETFKNVGKNAYAADIRGILRYIGDSTTGTYKADVIVKFMYAAEPRKLEEWITGLQMGGLIDLEYKNDVKDYLLTITETGKASL